MHKIFIGIFTLILSYFSHGNVVAQDLNSSPYTRYGLGEYFDFGTTAFAGIGGASVALATPGQINYANPATYGYVRKHMPILDAGYRVNILNNATTLSSQRNVVAGLRNFGLQLPISPRTGLVLGIMPYTTTGYKLENNQINQGDTVTYFYNGKGSINRAIMGIGHQLINIDDTNKLIKLSVGMNASYLFGTLQRDRSLLFENTDFYNTRITNKTVVRGFALDFGAHFMGKINKKALLQFGFNYSIGNQVNSVNDFYAYNFKYSNFGVEIEKDTVSYFENSEGVIKLPSSLALGAAITLNNKWLFTAQYTIQNWQQYSETQNGNEIVDPNIRQSNKVAIGMEYTPSTEIDSRDIGALSLSTYRFGAHYGYTPYFLADTHLKNYGINFGMSLPLVSSNTWSALNVGLELGKMGTKNNELIEQNYLKINLGFTLSSNKKYDKWFFKRLYE